MGDIFGFEHGDINAVELFTGTAIAWHRHQFQDDRIVLLRGDLLVQAIDREDIRHRWELEMVEDQLAELAQPVFIPRGWWHGYSTVAGATILSFNGPKKWDGSDEERRPIDETMPWTL